MLFCLDIESKLAPLPRPLRCLHFLFSSLDRLALSFAIFCPFSHVLLLHNLHDWDQGPHCGLRAKLCNSSVTFYS